jgi:hypothetical protein
MFFTLAKKNSSHEDSATRQREQETFTSKDKFLHFYAELPGQDRNASFYAFLLV